MEQEPQIREVLSRVRTEQLKVTSLEALERLITPSTKAGTTMILHMLWKNSSEGQLTCIRTYIEQNPETTTGLRAAWDNDMLGRRLGEKALATAVDLGMYDVVRAIVEESKPEVATETIMSLLLRKEFGILKHMVVCEVYASESAKLSTTRRKVKRWLTGSTATTYRLKVKDIVKLANEDKIEPSIITAFCLECGD